MNSITKQPNHTNGLIRKLFLIGICQLSFGYYKETLGFTYPSTSLTRQSFIHPDKTSLKLNLVEDNKNSNQDVDLTSSFSVLNRADSIYKSKQTKNQNQNQIEVDDDSQINTISDANANRRLFMAAALISSSTALNLNEAFSSASVANAAMTMPGTEALPYEKSPINKRSGINVFTAEQYGYNVRFVTYLSRFLLCFDEACQRWWYARAADLPRRATAEQIDTMRMNQFAAFSASVEVGLQEYDGPGGQEILMDSLLKRYCPDKNSDVIIDPKVNPDKAERQQREIKEARRQIALLFGLMESNQPVEKLTKLLAAIDNAEVMYVSITNRGGGYAPGYGPPDVVFPPPVAGDEFKRATGRAVLRPNGRILRVDVQDRGFGYSKPPIVTVSPPLNMVLNDDIDIDIDSKDSKKTYTQAEAKAILFPSGPNKGKIQRLEVTDAGSGYTDSEDITIKIDPPQLNSTDGGITATAISILEYEVGAIEITDGGSGYAAEKTMKVYVDPPPVTARINMNDPLLYSVYFKENLPSKKTKGNLQNVQNNLDSLKAKAESSADNNGKGGGGGCIGRACYDRPVEAIAFPRAEKDSYFSFKNDEDIERIEMLENDFDVSRRIVSGTVGGYDENNSPRVSFLGGSSSSQLLYLLPAGIGLEYNNELKRYQLSLGQGFENLSGNWMQGSSKPLSTEFGPRGRSPIERQKQLDLETALRFSLSGAICASGVHLAVTPIDVVKTKVQTDPVKYNGVFRSLNKVAKEEGIATFFTGWAPTFVGFFIWGGVTYTTTELFRRLLTEYMGGQAAQFEVPIILVAAGFSAFLGSFILTPSESVRIRTVSQPDFADSTAGVIKRIIKVSIVLCTSILFTVAFTIAITLQL